MSGIRRVIQINGPFTELSDNDYGYTVQDIASYDSLIDADLVLIDLRNIEQPLVAAYDGVYETQINFEYETKRKQIDDHLKSGKDVVAFVTGQAEVFSIEDDGYQNNYVRINKTYLLPNLERLVKRKDSGVNMIPCNDPMKSALTELDEVRLFNYKYILEKKEIDIPLLKIRNTDEIVAGVKFQGKGRIYYLPAINEKLIPSEKSKQIVLADKLTVFIEKLSSTIKQKTSNHVPTWVKEIKLLDEESRQLAINEIDEKIFKLNLNKNDQLDRINEIIKFKSILSSSGDQLEEAVSSIFKYIGMEVLYINEKNRVDFIIKNNGRYIVCEVKGVAGTAKESHAAQLEKWSSEFYAEKLIIPKPLLIVATYNRLPVSQRKDSGFPPQMMKYITMKQQACMNTVTLLKILKKHEADSWDASSIFEYLFNAVGLIEI